MLQFPFDSESDSRERKSKSWTCNVNQDLRSTDFAEIMRQVSDKPKQPKALDGDEYIFIWSMLFVTSIGIFLTII